MVNTASLVIFYFYPVFMMSMTTMFHSRKFGQWIVRMTPYVRNIWERLGLFGVLYSRFTSIVITVGYVILIIQIILLGLFGDGYRENIDILLEPVIIISVVWTVPSLVAYFCGTIGFHTPPNTANNIFLPTMVSILRVVEVKINRDPENIQTEECQICYNDYDTNIVAQYECRCSVKKACQECILTYFQSDNRCPWCRNEVNHVTKISYQ